MKKQSYLNNNRITAFAICLFFILQFCISSGILLVNADSQPPSITNIKRSPDLLLNTEPIVISCNIEDESIIDRVILHYTINDQSYSVFMESNEFRAYSTILPIQTYDTLISYYITAYDSHGNYQKSDKRGPFKVYDAIKPVITDVSRSVDVVTNQDEVIVSATVTDNYELNHVKLYYGDSHDNYSTAIIMNNTSGDRYEGTIPQMPLNSHVFYKISAIDNSELSNEAESKDDYYVTDGIHPYVVYMGLFSDGEQCDGNPATNSPFEIQADAWDNNGIKEVTLSYYLSTTGTWTYDVSMNVQDHPSYDGVLAKIEFSGLAENTNLTFYIKAVDTSDMEYTTQTPTYTIIIDDTVPPVISNVVIEEDRAYVPYKYIDVNATITDVSGIGYSLLHYDWWNETEKEEQGKKYIW